LTPTGPGWIAESLESENALMVIAYVLVIAYWRNNGDPLLVKV
jgi:hypothetical protein